MDDKLIDLVSKVPALAEKVYDDAASGAVRELGGVAQDIVKTLRLAFFPIQYAAAYQDRLVAYLDKAVRKVPAENLVAPVESIALPIMERLRYHAEESVLSEMYVNLLRCAMDRERVGEAHPAFVNIVVQLSPDEALFINELSGYAVRPYMRDTRTDGSYGYPLAAERTEICKRSPYDPPAPEYFESVVMRPEVLTFPNLFSTYLEHLCSLGLVEYSNDKREVNWIVVEREGVLSHMFYIRLTGFGRLFYSACVRE